ncbi:MAG: hypothetical protein ACHP65_02710 [Legionellales bacterium]
MNKSFKLKKHPEAENNLVRLHPNEGGVTVNYANQTFQGLTPDVFIGLDYFDITESYRSTRKFNISIAVNPEQWPAKDFFSYFTQGENAADAFTSAALQKTDKCIIHGDKNTGLEAHKNLLDLLQPKNLKPTNQAQGFGFDVDNKTYLYDSIGVAANSGYKPTGMRQNATSHFEIKFICLSNQRSADMLCLNIHLSPNKTHQFGQASVCERLKQAVNLFYDELGVLANSKHKPKTRLRASLDITLDNYQTNNFSPDHEVSIAVLEKYQNAKPHVPNRDLNGKQCLFERINHPPAPPTQNQLPVTPQLSRLNFFGALTSSNERVNNNNDNVLDFNNDQQFPPLRSNS